MTRDPLYEQIVAGLAGHLDPTTFERCAYALLLDEFPGLAPVPGGADSGTDGALPGQHGPVICTTAKDVARNLKKNLDARIAADLPGRRAVFVTSQTLTAQKRFKLEQIARERGFTLEQVIEREGLAERLYRSPRWYKELLDLTGSPPALAAVPRTRRPFLDLEPVGRDADLEWLRSTPGDRVLVGEPGSGKTFLLARLAREGRGLFLASADPVEIANAIREQKPGTIFVDDAHRDPALLEHLRHLRDGEARAEFSILATTWPGARDRITSALGDLSSSQVRKLELLTRVEILDVFRQAGIDEHAVRQQGFPRPEEVLRELVTLAANKPGLAVTLASLWLRGDWQDVHGGTALARTLLASLHELVGWDATVLLASFSLGGQAGMAIEDVRAYLEISRSEIWERTSDLAAAGVLSDRGGDALAVMPRHLRAALLRQVFFKGSAPSLDWRPLFERAQQRESAVLAIVEAVETGGTLDARMLRDLIEETASRKVWQAYAWLGQAEACHAVSSSRVEIAAVAAPALALVPQDALPRLLGAAAAADRAERDRLLGSLRSWAQEDQPTPEILRRRQLLARTAATFLQEGGDREFGTQAAFIALSPGLESVSRDPGAGTTVSWRSGLLPLPALERMGDVWSEIRSALELDASTWPHFSGGMWSWLYPTTAAKREVSDEEEGVMHVVAANILRDLAPRAAANPGLAAGLQRLASKIGVDLAAGLDPVFEALYPPDALDLEDLESRKAAQQKEIDRLADEWAREPPAGIARRLLWYMQEARKIGLEWSLEGPRALVEIIADDVDEPEDWLDAFLVEAADGNLAAPFLSRIVRERRHGWEESLLSCLRSARHVWSATSIALRTPDLPGELMEAVLDQLHRFPQLVRSTRDMPLPTLRSVLEHPRWEVALAAAVGEWTAGDRGSVRSEVSAEWRAAILRARTDEYPESPSGPGEQTWLGAILGSDPTLAFDWLRARLDDPDLPGYALASGPFSRAVRALDQEQRRALLKDLQPHPILDSLLPWLVGNDLILYSALLLRPDLRDYHLDPLRGLPDETWVAKATLALDSGYLPEEVAGAAYRTSHSWVGFGNEYWTRWKEAFAALQDNERSDLREVARFGIAEAEKSLETAHRERKRLEIEGV